MPRKQSSKRSHFDRYLQSLGRTREQQAKAFGISRRQLQRLIQNPPKLSYPLEFYQALAADAASQN